MASTENEKRNLTDADVQALVAEAQKVMVAQFYSDLGKGVWVWLKRGIVLAIIAVAALGYMKGK
jgi:hypothetical protein